MTGNVDLDGRMGEGKKLGQNHFRNDGFGQKVPELAKREIDGHLRPGMWNGAAGPGNTAKSRCPERPGDPAETTGRMGMARQLAGGVPSSAPRMSSMWVTSSCVCWRRPSRRAWVSASLVDFAVSSAAST